MKVVSHPNCIDLKVNVPPSKSYLQRAIALACFSNKKCELLGYEPSNDVDAALSVAKSLGKIVQIEGNKITIEGSIQLTSTLKVNMGESGLCTRMFAPALALLKGTEVTLDGEGSLLKRPMNKVVDVLTQLGCKVSSNKGFLPISIHSSIQLNSDNIIIDASDSSQLLTGVLIAVSMMDELKNNSKTILIEVQDLVSKPYIDVTLQVLKKFNITIKNNDFKQFEVNRFQLPNCDRFTTEGDWSGAAFLLVAGALAGQVSVDGLDKDSVQSDRVILDVLYQCGADVKFQEGVISCSKGNLNAFVFDATHCPDLFPPLAALASQCIGVSVIKGTQRLLNKESDRANTIKTVLTQLGVEIELTDNEMLIKGGVIKGGEVASHNDHRIAMMAAVLGLVANSPVIINEAEAIKKSYPKFYEDLAVLS